MRFDFDPAKDAANRLKHGVPLSFGSRVFDDPLFRVFASIRAIDGEERHKAVGYIEGKLWTAVYNERETGLRLISVRRSNSSEQGNYDRDPEGSE